MIPKRCPILSLAALALLAPSPGCDDGTPDPPVPDEGVRESYTLAGPGFEVVVGTAPYGWTVRDSAGRTVLGTAPGGGGDGYGPLAMTTGSVDWGVVGSPGWFSFEPYLDPWLDSWVAVEASASADRVELRLVPAAAVGEDGEADPSAPAIRVVHRVQEHATLRVEAAAEGFEPRAFAAAFASPGDEGFLGLGERYTRTDFRGLDVYNWAEEGGVGTGEGDPSGPANPLPNGESMTYYPVPFFVSTLGYAFWLDSTWRSEFNLATEKPDAFRAWHIGPDLAFEVYLPWEGDPRPWPYHLVDAFTARTGRPMLPPEWAFGPRRRIGRGSEELGVHEVQAMRDLDLAITAVDDAVHFLPAGSHVGIEADLAAWTAYAEGLGAYVCGYYNPYLGDEDDNVLRDLVEEGLEEGHFLLDATGEASRSWLISGSGTVILTVDFTSPEAKAWWQSMLSWAVDLGYRGWMQDFGEYVSPDVVSASGISGEELHNLFPVLYHQAAHEAMEAGPLAGKWLAFVRSGFTGSSQWAPMVWSGDPAASFEDSDGLPSMVRAAVNLGVSGAPNWGGDISGFHCFSDGADAADGELLARWIQQGAATPNMMDQSACTFAEDSADKADIFDSEEGQRAWKTYARLHTRLFPYLYSLSHEAHATGAPIVRHVFFEHPDRPDLSGTDDAYYLGPALFVAPVVERGATTKTVTLPEGDYLDWSDAAPVTGGTTVTLDAPLDKLPLLLRAGHLVPLLDPAIDTLAEESNPDVVGPADVADVYDVVVALSPRHPEASFTLWDGGLLSARLDGDASAPSLSPAASEEELATCAGCYLDEALPPGRRLRISAPDGGVQAGGLTLASKVGRRVRWDVWLLE
ncbi:hypothetical protein L6R50_22970 [Myxococcota bacterium]|nr:hypothetical protein [Myxococcota bacterium]